MASSIFGQGQNPFQQVMQLKQLMGSGSPQQMLQNLISKNPNYGYLNDLVQQNNGDIRATVENLARQQGVDLNDLYRQFTQK